MSSHLDAIIMEDDKHQELSFFKELDELVFERSNGTRFHFSDNKPVLKLFHHQCPKWNDEGITSVPMARRPHFLLCGQQMTNELEKNMRPNLKGDEAEKNLYRLFIENISEESPGMIVIPNFNTKGRFATRDTNVEVDMIVIHPANGVFLFNVKNKGQKGTSVNAMRKELEKHTRFVHLLQTYRTDDSPTAAAIHSVICDFANEESKLKELENLTFRVGEKVTTWKVFFLGKRCLRQYKFRERVAFLWQRCHNYEHPCELDMGIFESIEVLAARLVALKLFEMKHSLINSSIQTELRQGSLQSQKNRKLLAAQLGDFEQIPGFESCLSMNSEIEFPPGKRKTILWTKDQIKVAAAVYEHLTATSSKPLRLLVTGGKGSGKTFLLILIAKIAQTILKEGECNNDDQTMRDKSCLVCDGSFYSYGLTKMLTGALSSVGVTVFNHGEEDRNIKIEKFGIQSEFVSHSSAFEFNERFHFYKATVDCITSGKKEKFDVHKNISGFSFENDFLIALNQCRVFLCDEFTMDVTYPLLEGKLRKDQHCVFFTSTEIKNLESVLPEFEQINLDSCLRSTCQLAEVSNDWLKQGLKGTYLTLPLNNFEGEKLDIRQSWGDFDLECFELINSYAHKLEDLDVLPVAAFVNNRTLENLLEKLQKASYSCYVNHTKIPNYQRKKRKVMRKTTHIMFFDPRRFDGCEWSTVLVLLDFGCIPFNENLERDFFIAITRASMKVAMIFRDIVCKEQIPKFWRDPIETKLKQAVSNCNQTENENSKPTTLFVGETPELFNHLRATIEKSPAFSLPDVKGVSLHKLYSIDSGQFFVCHIDDVFLVSDLQKFSQFGIQSIFVSHASTFESNELFHFYKATVDCITAGKKKKFDVHENISSFQQARERSRNLSEFMLDHSQRYVEIFIPQPKYENLWEKWEAKGLELQRLGNIDSAKICYQYSAVNLDKKKIDFERMERTSLKDWFSRMKYEFRSAMLYRRLAAIEGQNTISESERLDASQ